MSERCLWITPKWPLPAEDGARQATCSLIKGLTQQGIVIDLLSIAGKEEEIDFKLARETLGLINIYVIRRASRKKSKLELLKTFLKRPFVPITFAGYAKKGINKKILNLYLGSSEKISEKFQADQTKVEWNYVVYDGLHAAAHAMVNSLYKNPFPKDLKIIYRAHNREQDLWSLRAKQEKNCLLRCFLYFQKFLVARFEQSLLKSAAGLAAVSPDDESLFLNGESNLKSVVVPIGLNFTAPLPFENINPQKHLLFVGRLDWLPNKDGLKWFLNNVWQKVSLKRSDLVLDIVGSGDGLWLKEFSDLKNINILGRVDDLTKYYREASAVIVPVFYGSGTRVKVIEAASYGRACIGTAIGVAMGLNLKEGEDYLRAEDEEAWLQILNNINNEDILRIGKNVFLVLRQDFDINNAAAKFIDLMHMI